MDSADESTVIPTIATTTITTASTTTEAFADSNISTDAVNMETPADDTMDEPTPMSITMADIAPQKLESKPLPTVVTEPKALVWCKAFSFPWWPSQVMPEEMVPLALKKVPRPSNSLPVFFFGTHDYIWSKISNLKPYAEHFEEYNTAAGKAKPPKGFREALNEAAQPDDVLDLFFPPVSEEELKQQQLEELSDDDEEEEAEVDVKPKKKSLKRKSAVTAEPSPKKARTLAAKKEKKTANATDTSSLTKKPKPSRKSEIVVLQVPSNAADPQRLLSLRHKLQKIFLGDAMRAGDFGKVDGIMTELEKFNVTVDSLKETKIGKVIRRISAMNIEDEPANVVSRCSQLMESWKHKFMPTDAPVTTTPTVASVPALFEDKFGNTAVVEKEIMLMEEKIIEETVTTVDEEVDMEQRMSESADAVDETITKVTQETIVTMETVLSTVETPVAEVASV